jgi:hypothetical protein
LPSLPDELGGRVTCSAFTPKAEGLLSMGEDVVFKAEPDALGRCDLCVRGQRGRPRRLQGGLLHVEVILRRRAVLYLSVAVRRLALWRVGDEIPRKLLRSLHGGDYETCWLPLGEGIRLQVGRAPPGLVRVSQERLVLQLRRTYTLSVYAPLGYPYNRWCGSGWYGTEAQGSVWHNGAWRTTERVWSGSNFYF